MDMWSGPANKSCDASTDITCWDESGAENEKSNRLLPSDMVWNPK
jgi:hypothetical protein